jgi:hypothetical protein
MGSDGQAPYDELARVVAAPPAASATGFPDAGTTGAVAVHTIGVAPNEFTATEDRDPFVGTPWHEHVPARLSAS